MERKDRITLKKIEGYARTAVRFCDGVDSCANFEADEKTNMACVFTLMQIGELSKHGLSEALKSSLPDIPWKSLNGLRNRIVHDYDGINYQTVYDTIKYDLPKLCEKIKKLTD